MKHRSFDVVVVGGGHAGVEAALASVRRGAVTALVTQKASTIGVMSCNPAMGGIGKGHIIREVDAMDGVIGRAADYAGIQFRLLNASKGPATQGPRTQCDRVEYQNFIQRHLQGFESLSVVEAEVDDLLIECGSISGVRLNDSSVVGSKAVVLTTGTFLNGVIHIGMERRPAGRVGDKSSTRLADRIAELGLPLGRLKTGTPPRLNGKTVDWRAIDTQPADESPTMLSFLSTSPRLDQVSCGVTSTNAETHDIIRENLSKSAMYGGQIDGIGPRYCPSIEDKVVRFADKGSHNVFLEPEGLASDVVYPNGISTSLPVSVQLECVRTIVGLESVEIVQPGYAIEYDFVDPRSLNSRLELKEVRGLFLAGQINGTTGYEEASGQGLLAGFNAAATAIEVKDMVLSRRQSYIGVMIDDLITRGVSEPYRMFTSRSEDRLSLRPDNADLRLTPVAVALDAVSDERKAAFWNKKSAIDLIRGRLKETVVTRAMANTLDVDVKLDSGSKSVFDLLGSSQLGVVDLDVVLPECSAFGPEYLKVLFAEALYAPYIARSEKEFARLKRDESVILPDCLAYLDVPGLSNELAERLSRIRPKTLGQAGRIEGMTPAALTLVLLRARQLEAAE